MRTFILTLAMLLQAAVAWAAPIDLNTFLPEIEQATRPAVTLRADGELTTTTPEQTVREQIVLIQRDNNDLYLELRQGGPKALIIKDGGEAVVVAKGATSAAPFAPDAAFDNSDFTREDLQPFRVARYHTPRIVDATPQQVQVALFPQQSQYSLVVISFDREKKVPVKTMYYQQTLNNLVKMRRDSDHVLVGQRWLPTKITMENFPLRATSTLTLRWTQDPKVAPELFQPAFLPRPSNLTWPAAPPAPAGAPASGQ